MTKQELMNEADMIQGNINRMMVTDDLKELLSMYMWAERRLQTIHNERVKELGNAKPISNELERSERIKAINSIMELVSQYGYCNYLLGKNMRDDEKIIQLDHQQNEIYSIIRYELYAMIDRLEKEESEEK